MPKPKIDLFMSKLPRLAVYTCKQCGAQTGAIHSGPLKGFTRYGCTCLHYAVSVALLDRDLKTNATSMLIRKMGKKPGVLAEALFPAPKRKRVSRKT